MTSFYICTDLLTQKKFLISNNHSYVIHKENVGSIQWRCSIWRCNAILYTTNKNFPCIAITIIRNEHDHDGDIKEYEKMKIEEMLNKNIPYGKIVNTILEGNNKRTSFDEIFKYITSLN